VHAGFCCFLHVDVHLGLTKIFSFHKLYHKQLFPLQNDDYDREAQRVRLMMSAASRLPAGHTEYESKERPSKLIEKAKFQ
jgi:hypothetical protein